MQYLDALLQHIDVPDSMLLASREGSGVSVSVIDSFYQDVMFCIRKAVSDTIPKRKCADSHSNVPGWNAYVRDKHDLTREAYLVWVYDCKPKHGLHFETMKRTRAVFK